MNYLNQFRKRSNDISKDGKYATANQFLVTLSSIFNKAIKWELIDRNPTLRIDKHRERRLSYDEMTKFLQVFMWRSKCVDKRFCITSVIYWS
ncbi:hypothetical protein [Orientia tsutsugamushi]|uniref:hypothetical protein n=1 Tax=Orientia tsutsugamushi TaxID=784 RepID=UPI001EEDF54C|nr:hypothetical protein [Orientia tsutsugamushi]